MKYKHPTAVKSILERRNKFDLFGKKLKFKSKRNGFINRKTIRGFN